jgi:signal transduction histidine kinase
MLQIIDISQSIKYNQKIIENEMLGILNATVSHELRNPLNSLIGQNTKKAALYEKI